MLDTDLFIKVCPTPFKREIVVDFGTMEREDVLIELTPYAVGKYPVTNHQFFRFIMETEYYPEDKNVYSYEMFLTHWETGRQPPEEKLLHPVTFVSWDDAVSCAHFMGGRLPTCDEWLYAAFGNTNNRFPWGNIFFPERCNVRESNKKGTTPVGQYSPEGDSFVGCCDMVGNVWEWTSTVFPDEEEMFLAMGTGWDHYKSQVEIPLDRSYRNHSVGFRVVRDLIP